MSEPLLRFVEETTTVEVFDLDDCPPDPTLLPPEDIARFQSFKNDDAADAYIRRQSELRRRLAVHCDRRPDELRIETEPNGKPFLVDANGAATGPHFNMSSSARLMALAVDAEQAIGVDIECHGLHPNLVASDLTPALHPLELQRLAANRLDDILQCWVFKEAWIKWTGEGMRADLKSLELWRPDLPERFVHDGLSLRLTRIPPVAAGGAVPAEGLAWVGLARLPEPDPRATPGG
ncbi:MAG: 4'-phosphopantetheinyl transferase family protein [Acidimicrobiales bacterium]